MCCCGGAVSRVSLLILQTKPPPARPAFVFVKALRVSTAPRPTTARRSPSAFVLPAKAATSKPGFAPALWLSPSCLAPTASQPRPVVFYIPSPEFYRSRLQITQHMHMRSPPPPHPQHSRQALERYGHARSRAPTALVATRAAFDAEWLKAQTRPRARAAGKGRRRTIWSRPRGNRGTESSQLWALPTTMLATCWSARTPTHRRLQ